MKTKLLRIVRKDYSIVDYPLQGKYIVKYKGKDYNYFSYQYSNNIKPERYKTCIDVIVERLRYKYPKIGLYNRGIKVWYK